MRFPNSFIKDIFFAHDQKTLIHFIKIDPTKNWGDFEVKIEAREMNVAIPPAVQLPKPTKQSINNNEVECKDCGHLNDVT